MTFNSNDIWQIVGIAITVLGAFWGIATALLKSTQRHINEKFEQMSRHMSQQDESTRRIERDLMDLKVELPRDYVRREDHTQVIATIMTKLDAFQLRVEGMFRELLQHRTGGPRE